MTFGPPSSLVGTRRAVSLALPILSKDDLVVLRHQTMVLKRNAAARVFAVPSALMAAMIKVLPRARWSSFVRARRHSFGGTES